MTFSKPQPDKNAGALYRKMFFSSNDGEQERFETWVYSSDARLNEERRGILNDIQKRGSVYAR